MHQLEAGHTISICTLFFQQQGAKAMALLPWPPAMAPCHLWIRPWFCTFVIYSRNTNFMCLYPVEEVYHTMVILR